MHCGTPTLIPIVGIALDIAQLRNDPILDRILDRQNFGDEYDWTGYAGPAVISKTDLRHKRQE
jgi:hypothetical protein